MARVRIGDMLVKAGLIDEMQLQSALAQQKQWGGRIGDILVDKGFVDEMMLWKGLSKQLGVPLVSLPTLGIPRELAATIPKDLCEKNEIFPIKREERQVTVATSNPNNVGGLDEIAFRLGLKLKVVLAPQREIDWAIRHLHMGDPSPCPPPRERYRPELNGEMQIVQSDQMVPGAVPAPSEPPKMQLVATAPGLPPTWVPTLPGGAPPMRQPSLVPVPATTPRPGEMPTTASEAEASLREATQLLKAVIEVCVSKGIFTREEYIERLKSLG